MAPRSREDRSDADPWGDPGLTGELGAVGGPGPAVPGGPLAPADDPASAFYRSFGARPDPYEGGGTSSGDTAVLLERQLLLEEGIAAPRPARRSPQPGRRAPAHGGVILVLALVVAGATLGLLWSRDRRRLEHEIASLEAQAARSTQEGDEREASLRRQLLERDKQTLERKAEADRLAGLLESALDSLKRGDEERRRIEAEKADVERAYRVVLAGLGSLSSAPDLRWPRLSRGIGEALRGWLLGTSLPAGEGGEPRQEAIGD